MKNIQESSDAKFFAAGQVWDEQVERFRLLGEKATENQLIEMLIASTVLLNEYAKREAKSETEVAMAKGTRDGIGLLLILACVLIGYLVLR